MSRNRPETHPVLQARLRLVERRVERTRRRLERQVDRALIPLDIQEDVGISRIRGDVLIVTRNEDVQRKVRNLVESDGYRCDIAETGDEAIGFLKIAKYRMVILDRTRRGRTQVFRHIQRYLNHVKVVSIVRNERQGRESMLLGGYSFLLGRSFDPQQLSTCLRSSLQMKHRVCYLLAQGEPCNRSCVENYESDDDIDEMEYANPDFTPPDTLQTDEQQADFFEELREIDTHRDTSNEPT